MAHTDEMLDALTDVKMFNYAPSAEAGTGRAIAGHSLLSTSATHWS